MQKNDSSTKKEKKDKEFEERVLQVDRVTYVVAGGKRLRFRVLVAIGDKKGRVGIGIGKAQEVVTAVEKAVTYAKRHLLKILLVNSTIPHEIRLKYGSSYIFLKPARLGTSIIAGGVLRTIFELAGIKNILSKILGSSNKINNAKAVMLALEKLSSSSQRSAVEKIGDEKKEKK